MNCFDCFPTGMPWNAWRIYTRVQCPHGRWIPDLPQEPVPSDASAESVAPVVPIKRGPGRPRKAA